MARRDPSRRKAALGLRCVKQESVGSRGMVSTNHPLASVAGAEMLTMGGNAVDAAVAAAFALTTVEPMMVGVFGAGFLLYYQSSSGQVISIDNYARAPIKATPDMFQPDDAAGPLEAVGRANQIGHLSVGVPGALKAWCFILEKHGRLGLETVLAPAIRYAQRGFQASPYLVSFIATDKNDIARYADTARVFLPKGRPPRPGDVVLRPDYAETLKLIARGGAEVLHTGSLGESVAKDMARSGGLIDMEDLAAYEFHLREPVRGTYRGCQIVSVGPTSSGGLHIVQALNLLEAFDVRGMGFATPEYFHLLLEVLKVC